MRGAARLLGLAALWLASGCDTSGPVLLPVGEHEAHVGVPLVIPLSVVDPGSGGLRWSLLEAPEAMGLESEAGQRRLVWLATAFDLALTQPGQPRAAGQPRTIRVRACDSSGACGNATGSVRAVPTPP